VVWLGPLCLGLLCFVVCPVACSSGCSGLGVVGGVFVLLWAACRSVHVVVAVVVVVVCCVPVAVGSLNFAAAARNRGKFITVLFSSSKRQYRR
jgi:hypothetical protein